MNIPNTDLRNALCAWQGHGGYSAVGRILEAETSANKDSSKAKHQILSVNVSLPPDISDLVNPHPTAFSYMTMRRNGCFQLKWDCIIQS